MRKATKSSRFEILFRSVGVSIGLWGLLTPPSAAAAQSAAPQGLARDFDVLVELVEATHPDPYTAFGGAEGFARTADSFRQEAADVANVQELHALAQRFLAILNDGHTRMRRPAARSAGTAGWSPLLFAIATDAMYVQAAAPEMREYVGSKLLEINDLPLSAVLDSVRTIHPSENLYGAMNRLRGLLVRRRPGWPPILEREAPLRLTLETPGTDTFSVAVRFSDDRPDYSLPERSLDLGGDNGLLYGKLLRHGGRRVGYFFWRSIVSREVAERMYSQNPANAGWAFEMAFRHLPDARRTGDLEKDLALIPSLYERFSHLLDEMRAAGAEHLIIDLRRNSGGMTPLVYALLYMLYGDALLESELEAEYDTRLSRLYLSKMGFADIGEFNARYGTDFATGDFRDGHLFKNDLSLPIEERRSSSGLTSYGSEYFRPRDEPYTPKAVVVTAPATFSAAFHFTYFLTEIGGATAVGVPPRQAPNAFMESTSFVLPNSKLEGSISNSVQVLYPPGHPRAKVFTPDFAMTWDDFRRYRFDPDAEILYVLDLIETGRIMRGRPGKR